MKAIKREIRSSVFTTDGSNTSIYCQASFNSDGVITLRNHDIKNKDSDEIIILSFEETKAIFTLFSRIGTMNKNYDLPF